MTGQAIQDQMKGNFCWGCGADNAVGLQLKSYWDGDVVVAQWTPTPDFAAGPKHFLNGGIIATLLDCHGVCTALAGTYRLEEQDIGSEPEIWCATASITVEYLRPTPIDEVIHMTAQAAAIEGRFASVECVLASGDKERARATVRATRVPDAWRHGSPA